MSSDTATASRAGQPQCDSDRNCGAQVQSSPPLTRHGLLAISLQVPALGSEECASLCKDQYQGTGLDLNYPKTPRGKDGEADVTVPVVH